MKSRVFGLSLATFLAMTAAASAADVVADQGVLNGTTAPVANMGTIGVAGHIGDAFSAAVSATGAAAQVTISNINQGSVNIDGALARQDARNDASVANNGTVIAGPISGAGSSVTVSAIGSAASVTTPSIGSAQVATVFANQSSFNTGAINNGGAIVTSGNVGEAISTSISGIGAIAQASVTNVNGSNTLSGLTTVNATQTVMNSGAVNNVGTISSAMNAGAGQSLSISAVGAAAAVSVSSIR